jgi:hypothetical protein
MSGRVLSLNSVSTPAVIFERILYLALAWGVPISALQTWLICTSTLKIALRADVDGSWGRQPARLPSSATADDATSEQL